MSSVSYALGAKHAAQTYKLAEFNWELTGNKKKKDRISADNGRRTYGVNFNEPTRPSREVGQAFNSLSVQKPSDFLNDLSQGIIGEMR